MGWFWSVVGASAALGLTVLYLVDRRARRRGHQLRSASGMSGTVRAQLWNFRYAARVANRGFMAGPTRLEDRHEERSGE